MAKYSVDCTNPDEILAGLSYTAGRHGFCVQAETMADAINLSVSRAKADGFYGADWSARISRLGNYGRREGDDAIVGFYDRPRASWLEAYDLAEDEVVAYPDGGVRLW